MQHGLVQYILSDLLGRLARVHLGAEFVAMDWEFLLPVTCDMIQCEDDKG